MAIGIGSRKFIVYLRGATLPCGIVVAASLVVSVSAHAQDAQAYPSRSIRLIVPVPAGGGVLLPLVIPIGKNLS